MISAALCIRGKYAGVAVRVYVFKPLTTILIIAVALLSAMGAWTPYAVLVLLAFGFALAGDVFLMLPKDRFLSGLVSFLVAHIFLAMAFLVKGVGFDWWLMVLAFLTGFTMFGALRPYLGRMRVPAFFYVGVISAMAWLGWEGWLHLGGTGPALAAFGTVLFLVSDSTLAWNRFRGRFRSAELIILSTYYMSLFLIALSVSPGLE